MARMQSGEHVARHHRGGEIPNFAHRIQRSADTGVGPVRFPYPQDAAPVYEQSLDNLQYRPTAFQPSFPEGAMQFMLRWNADGTPRVPAPVVIWVLPLRARTSHDALCARCGAREGLYDVLPESLPAELQSKLKLGRSVVICPCRGALLD